MRSAVAIAVLLMAMPAAAADPPTSAGSASQTKQAGTKKADPTAPKTGTGDGKGAKTEAQPTSEQVAVRKAKLGFAAAVGACARPEDCDPQSRLANRDLVDMVKSAEAAFMGACEACAPREACEAEARRIGDGKRSPGFAPCK